MSDLLKKETFLFVSMMVISAGIVELNQRNYAVALGLLTFGLITVAVRAYLKTKGFELRIPIKKKK